MTPPFFGSKIMNLLVFSILSRKSVSGCRLHNLCIGRSGTSAYAVYALFQPFLLCLRFWRPRLYGSMQLRLLQIW